MGKLGLGTLCQLYVDIFYVFFFKFISLLSLTNDYVSVQIEWKLETKCLQVIQIPLFSFVIVGYCLMVKLSEKTFGWEMVKYSIQKNFSTWKEKRLMFNLIVEIWSFLLDLLMFKSMVSFMLLLQQNIFFVFSNAFPALTMFKKNWSIFK